MPRDAKGNFHLNTQRMMSHEPSKKPAGGALVSGSGEPDAQPEAGSGDSHIAIHSHGDGSYHTETNDGQREEHASLGHALMQAAHHHEPESKHAHVKHDGGGMQSTHVGEDGHAQGPHDHENLEALKSHLGKFFDEEENEYTGDQHQEHAGGDEPAGY